MGKQLQKREILSIFIGSPSDLQEERKIAHNVVERINKNAGRNLGIHLELRGWEDTLPGYGTRPQEIINEELIECDIFVGLLWQRWGTPPGGENGYTSGFEEEYNLALEQKEKDQMIDIFLFFKDMSESLKRDPGEQATQVLNFKDSVEKERKVFFDTFSEAADWKELFNDVLTGYITKNFISKKTSKEGEQTKQSKKDANKEVIDTIESLEKIQTSLRNEDYYSVDNSNIAKTTLYTTSLLYTKVLTDQVLNSTVLHLLYSDREKIKLHKPEAELILTTLLEDQDEIKTGWYWMSPDINVSTVMTYFAEGSVLKEVRLQALEFLNLVSTEKTREISHRIIEEENTDIAIEVAKQYSDLAEQNDIEFLKRIIDQREEELAKIAWSGVVHALMLENPNNAIDWIVETPSNDRGSFKKYLNEILSGADLNQQKKLLTTDDNKVSLATLNTICDQLSIEELRDLYKDENTDISSLALLELIKKGEEVSEEQIDELFDDKKSKNRSTNRTNLGDFFTNTYYSQLPKYGYEDLLYEYYKRQEKGDLEKRISWDSIKSPIIYAVLIDQNYNRLQEILKSDIKSGFSRISANTIESYRKQYGQMADEIIETVTKYDNMTKGSFYKYAFQVLSKNAQKDDLKIAEEYLEDPHFSYFKDDILISILEIIEKFGDENETDLLLNILDLSDYGVKRKAASILLKLDLEDKRKYAQELFQQDEISIYKILLNHSLGEEEVLTLDSVKELTYKPSRTTRFSALAYLAKKLSEDNLIEFLEQYPLAEGFDFYYYDIICWLDRIIYAPSPIKEYYHSYLDEFLE